MGADNIATLGNGVAGWPLGKPVYLRVGCDVGLHPCRRILASRFSLAGALSPRCLLHQY